MNPLLAAALGSIIRSVLLMGAGYLVSKGVWTNAEAGTYVTAAASALLAIGWGQWQKYKSRQKLVTAMAAGHPISEQAVEHLIDSGVAPPVNLPKDRVPYLEGNKPKVPYSGPDKRTIVKEEKDK